MNHQNIVLSFVAFVLSMPVAAAPAPQKTDLLNQEMKTISQKYSALVLNSYESLLTQTVEMQKKIKDFTKAPSAASQEAAKEAWKLARLSYSPTEAFRFYGGPIDSPENNIEPMMNAWPIDESYIDAVKDKPQSGIINHADIYPQINKEMLIANNEKDGERNVATGWHAIEFLLWGQDLDLVANGKRSFEEYIPGKNPNAQRRSQYLEHATDLLVDHSRQLVKAWQSDAAYPKALASEKPDEILRRILTGMTSLSADEMAGERMTVALEKNDQENEQDCFSDFTLNDLIANQEGVMAVYNQAGVKELFAKTDRKLEGKISKQLETSMKLLKAVPAPFDKLVSNKKGTPEKKKAHQAIASLQRQAHLISEMAKKFHVELNVQ